MKDTFLKNWSQSENGAALTVKKGVSLIHHHPVMFNTHPIGIKQSNNP